MSLDRLEESLEELMVLDKLEEDKNNKWGLLDIVQILADKKEPHFQHLFVEIGSMTE